MKPSFTIKLNQPVVGGLVVTGKFDGKRPSIACATTGGRILVHSPHEENTQEGQNNVRYLNMNRKITALAAGKLGKDEGVDNPDLLFVGSQSNLLAYDVERNADKFFVDVQDGVNALAVGKLGSNASSMIFAGGNCSLLGFDDKGDEAFWTVTGDNVSSMSLASFDNSPRNHLIVGSDDFEIRVFRNEEMVAEITEADRVTFLHPLGEGKFAYGLENGTVGVYERNTRLWRVKTKHRPTALFAYDIDMDGVPEIISGWSNGSFNVRRLHNGEVLFRTSMDAPIASIFKSDYRMDGKEELIIVSEAGTVHGYLPTEAEFGAMLDSGVAKETAADQKMLDDLHREKLELIAELKLIDKTLKVTKSSEVPVGSLPGNTALTYKLIPDRDLQAIALRVEVNTDVQIVNLIVVDLEGIVLSDREVLAISPRAQSKTAILPLRPVRNAACTVRVQTHVALRSSVASVHVFESDVSIPKFAAFRLLSDIDLIPKGFTMFSVKESNDRFGGWFESSFLLDAKIMPSDERFRIGFQAVHKTLGGFLQSEKKQSDNVNDSWAQQNKRSAAAAAVSEGDMLVISLQRYADAGQTWTRVRIHSDNLELVADVIQDLAKYFKWTELESEADFPIEFDAFQQVITSVAECNAARMNLTADMADDAQRIKALVIRAEDSRLMMDFTTMRRSYHELNGMNNQLVQSYNTRAQNHETLLQSLKEVNQMIQKASNLRCGKAKSRVVADCRNAVKNNNMQSLFRILKQGYEPGSISAVQMAQSK